MIPIELANTISLFLASPTPMLSALTTATINFVVTHSDLPVTNTTDTLATIVQVGHSNSSDAVAALITLATVLSLRFSL